MIAPSLVKRKKRIVPTEVSPGVYVFYGCYDGAHEFFDTKKEVDEHNGRLTEG